MDSECVGDASSSMVDTSFSLDDGLNGNTLRIPKFHDIAHGQNLIIDEESPSLPINPDSISRLNIEKGEYPAVVISFKYLSGVVNDHFNWVNHELGSLEARHVLNKAKILSAVLISSLCSVNKDRTLLCHLVRRWSRETHTFVCSWGEFTPTLEDVANVTGLPITGSIDPSNIQISMEDVDKLDVLRTAKDRFSLWVKHFWGFIREEGDRRVFKKGPGYSSGCRMEALLSLWLSKFVFPDGKDVIQERVFPLALLLSRGEAFPLAPMFLGHLYQSLDLIATQEKEGHDDRVIESCVSTVFLQMFIWERLKGQPMKPTPLATFRKKELLDFKPDNLPLMYRWVRRTALVSISIPDCLDDEEKFNFRPYVDLASEVPLNLLSDGCQDPIGIVVEPVKKCHEDASLDIYLVVRRGLLPTFGEKSKLSFVSYSPHRVRRQFGLDQGVPCGSQQSEEGGMPSDLFYGKLEALSESASVMLAGRERIGYKSEAFHAYWLEVLSGFSKYIRCGTSDLRLLSSRSNNDAESLSEGALEPRGRGDGRKEVMMGEGSSGKVCSNASNRKRRIHPKVVEDPLSKKRTKMHEPGKIRASEVSCSKSITQEKKNLHPREPQKIIYSSGDEDPVSDNALSPHDSTDSSDEENVCINEHDQHVNDQSVQTILTHGEKGGKISEYDAFLPRPIVAPLEEKKESEPSVMGSSSIGIPQTPLFVSPILSQSVPQFPAKTIEEVPPGIKDFVHWSAQFESGARKLDKIEQLHPSTYSVERRMSFHGMYVCPEVIAPLTVFFEKYGDMSQLDCFKHCMCDTKSMIFERLGFVLYSMDKTLMSNLVLDDILAWRDVVRDLMCLNVPIGFLIRHLQKLLRVCYFLQSRLPEETLHQMGKIRLLEGSAEDIFKRITTEQRKLRDLLARDPNFPTEYSEYIVESTSGVGRTGLLGLLDCKP